jgi:drug/metabolite transporter (DMT)-like permease
LKAAPDFAAEAARTSTANQRHHLMHWAMLCAVFFWSANMVAIKEALAGFSPLALAVVRALAAALVFGTLYLILRGRSLPRLSRRQWLYFVGMAFCGVTLNQMFFIGGVARTSVPHAALVVAVGPVMVLVLSVVMRMERLTLLKFLGMAISFSGVALLTYGRGGPGNHSHWLGDMIMLGQSVVFAFYTILMKGIADQYDGVTLNAIVFGLGALMMIPFGAQAVWRVSWSQIPARSVLGLSFMVLFSSVIAYLLFAFALTGLTASRVAAFNYLEPIIATALGIWLLHDRVSLQGIFGGVLILLGVYFTEQERGEEHAGSTIV